VVKADRVSRAESWVVGAVPGEGGSAFEEKEAMDQRTIQCSLAALERMRSPYQDTLCVLVGGRVRGVKN
jgi:hypothetical protein